MAYIIMGELFTFPEGDSSTNRVYSYGKGFLENGINVHVVCFGNLYTTYGDGQVAGINYYHPYGQNKRSPYFFVRTLKKIRKYIRTTLLIRKINKQDKINAIIVYSLLPGTFLFARFLSVIIKSALIQEVSEHPLRYFQSNAFQRGLGDLKVRMESNLTDGIFCISKYLVDFYEKRNVPSHKLFKVPSTVDPGRFTSSGDSPLPFPYIGYFGALTFHRDNVDLLLEAFAMIAKKYPGIHLVMGGAAKEEDRLKVKNMISELGISDRAILLEFLPREEIVRYIVNADILIMVRKDDYKSQASFPSKLAEYLATSKPVITVDVGEVSQYLTNGVNAFIVEAGSSEKLAEKIDYVLSQYASALEAAKQGRSLAVTTFNYSYQAKRITRFIDTLKRL